MKQRLASRQVVACKKPCINHDLYIDLNADVARFLLQMSAILILECYLSSDVQSSNIS